jgi:hypothetical protein
MLSFSILYWDLIKFHYFADTTKEGIWGESRPKDRVTLWITLMCMTLEAEDARKFWMAAHVTPLQMTNAYHQPYIRTGHMSFSYFAEFRHRTQAHKSQISYKLLHVSKLYSLPTSHIFFASLVQVFHSLVSFSTQNIPTSFWYVLKLH